MPAGWEHETEKADRHELRGHITHVAMIAHEPAVQPLLPQVLLGNERRFTLKFLRDVQGELPANIQLWRRKSGWTNHIVMTQLLAVLAKALGSLMATRYVILLLDCAPQHFHPTVIACARRRNTRLIFVPAKLTFLLQPCDTHVFARFKAFLRSNWAKERTASVDGEVSVKSWLLLLVGAIRKVLQGVAWRDAFLHTGVLQQQQGLSKYVLAHLAELSPPTYAKGPPSVEDARLLFPRNTKANIANLMLWPAPKARAKAAPLVAPPLVPPALPLPLTALPAGVAGSAGPRRRLRIIGLGGGDSSSSHVATRGVRALPWTLRPRRATPRAESSD